MKELLQESWKLVQRDAQEERPFPEDVICAIKAWYDTILEQGEKEWVPSIPMDHYAKGRVKKIKAANLGERLSFTKMPFCGLFGIPRSLLTTIRLNVIYVWLK